MSADISTSEFGYYLIAELITMPDRILAQQMELVIWNKTPTPDESMLCKFIDLLKESEEPEWFYEEARKYVNSLPIQWHISQQGGVIRGPKE